MILEEKKDYQLIIIVIVIILVGIRIVVVVVCVLNMMMIVIEKPMSIIQLEVCVCKWSCNNLQQQQYQTKYLDIYYELNNGNEETFWFNLIILKGINIIFIFFLLKQYLIIIIDYVIKNIFDNDSKFLNLTFLPFLINDVLNLS